MLSNSRHDAEKWLLRSPKSNIVTADRRHGQPEAMLSHEVDRLIEADQLSEAELQAMSHSDLAELRRIMLKALELYLTRALHTE